MAGRGLSGGRDHLLARCLSAADPGHGRTNRRPQGTPHCRPPGPDLASGLLRGRNLAYRPLDDSPADRRRRRNPLCRAFNNYRPGGAASEGAGWLRHWTAIAIGFAGVVIVPRPTLARSVVGLPSLGRRILQFDARHLGSPADGKRKCNLDDVLVCACDYRAWRHHGTICLGTPTLLDWMLMAMSEPYRCGPLFHDRGLPRCRGRRRRAIQIFRHHLGGDVRLLHLGGYSGRLHRGGWSTGHRERSLYLTRNLTENTHERRSVQRTIGNVEVDEWHSAYGACDVLHFNYGCRHEVGGGELSGSADRLHSQHLRPRARTLHGLAKGRHQ